VSICQNKKLLSGKKAFGMFISSTSGNESVVEDEGLIGHFFCVEFSSDERKISSNSQIPAKEKDEISHLTKRLQRYRNLCCQIHNQAQHPQQQHVFLHL
jgi:hypothetical protein